MADRHKIICIQAIHEKGMNILRARDDIELIVPDDQEPQSWKHHLDDAEGIIVRVQKIPRWIIEHAPNLKIISRHGVGVDNIDMQAAAEKGVIVATVGQANAASVVEHTLALILALAKQLPDFDNDVRTGDYWRKFKLDAVDIRGRSVLIIGLGRIGSRLAVVLNALGMHCIGVDPKYSAQQIEAMGCEPCADFRTALPNADVVTLHCPMLPETRNMIGAAELAAMKPTAYLINCARGGIVDEAALIAALDNGVIKAAALDVQVTEPPLSDDPLLKCKRIILTPHAATATVECIQQSAIAVAHNITEYFDGCLTRERVFDESVIARHPGRIAD